MPDIEEHEIGNDEVPEVHPFSLGNRPVPFEKDFRPKEAVLPQEGMQVVAVHSFSNEDQQSLRFDDSKTPETPAPSPPDNPDSDEAVKDDVPTKKSPLSKK